MVSLSVFTMSRGAGDKRRDAIVIPPIGIHDEHAVAVAIDGAVDHVIA
jgi:hypothetical protein